MEVMTEDSVWGLLAKIPIGTIVAWIVVLAAIVTTICLVVIKSYKAFTKYNKLKDENEKQKETIKEHDKLIKDVNDSLAEIKSSLATQTEVNLKQIRHTIVHTCDDALSAGAISAGKFKSLEELFEEYTNVFHGNGYVKTMVEKVRALPIIGNLDD